MTETPAQDVQPSEDRTPSDESALSEPEATGHSRIDEALARLDALDELDINDHPEQFEAIHQALRESLARAGRDGDAPESP